MCRACIALLAILLIGLAGSYRPAPANWEDGEQDQRHADSSSGNSAHHCDQTEPSSALHCSPSPEGNEKTPNYNSDNSAPEKGWSVHDPNTIIAVFTVILAFVGAAQVGVGVFQWLTYCRQARIMESQQNLTVDLQRPYVYGRVTKTGLTPTTSFFGENLQRGILELCVDNIGTTPANLTRIEWGIFTAPTGDIPAPIDSASVGGRELPVGTIAVKGEPYFEQEKLALRFIEEQKDIMEFKRSVWVIGFVRYSDIFGKNHISGFAHALDLIHERFVRRGGDRYNYAREENASDIPSKSS
jgi:hypothetical protein